VLYWAQVNDEFAKNWQNFKKIKKTNCCNILKFVGPRGKLSSVSQLNNTAVLLNHKIRSKVCLYKKMYTMLIYSRVIQSTNIP
jgi:hypothetical protein